ncbi:Cohesin subunit SA-1 SCC3 -like protein 1 [Triplophysa tibetana]|uniref:Cohesin subunit SA n=1 Tax=Triplophysa tibetana TaxID=1572043 RepID=A0A5A9NIJ3_9TELE|nr:Cohesin subunit SA-1 SCC3 -like protein 1 [Triplophysa tibetana]
MSRRTAGNTRGLRRRDVQTDDHATTGDLYEAVRSGRSALPTVIDDWLDEYRRDKEMGLLELINFVIQCSGCKGVVTKEMLSTMQNADIIGHLTEEFNEDSVSYPLVSVGSDWRHFRKGLCEFLSLLVRSCRNSLLYDDYLFSSLIALLTGLADSQVRAFRHTSTLIAMRLMSAIVVVAAEVNAQAAMTKRRCDMEKIKRAEERAIGREEELENSLKEVSEHQEDLRSLMNGIFKGVFVHRYRDRVPDIRAICMEEMGVWFRENPACFLNDEHLKYVGWMLHDKERIVCMILDKDSDVAVETVKLLLLIHQNTDDGLSDDECVGVYPLVFATHRGLACAAGHFLYHMLCSVLDEESGNHIDSFPVLLARFFNDSKYHEHAAYLVDSLWDVAGAELKNWEVMTSLLLQEGGVEEGMESALIDIMVSAMRQAAEATPPLTRSQKKNLTMREKKLQAQEMRRITNHFIPVLPQLLAKFSADVGKVSCLLRAPLYFHLDAYGSSARLEKVCDIVLKHSEECVLEASVRVLCSLCCDSYTFSGRAERAVSQLFDSTVEKFTTNLTKILQESADEDDYYRAASSLNILAVFSSASDMTGRNLFEFCSELMKFEVESGEMDKKAFVCLCDALMVFGSLSEGEGSPLQCYSPDESLTAEMASFLIDYVFTDSDHDLIEEMNISGLMQKRNQLAGYCKLIIYGVLELRAATDILKYYNKFYREYGDIIKETLSKSKTISSVESAKTVCLCLQQLFSGLDQDHRDEELTEIRILAKKLASNFSINQHLIRKPLLSLHQDGIRFACKGFEQGNSMNLGFLTDTLAVIHSFITMASPFVVYRLEYLRRVGADVVKSLISNPETPAVTLQARRHDTDDEFTEGSFQMRTVTHSRPQSSPSAPSIQTHLSTLSLIDGDHSDDEPVIEDYDDDEDSETGIILPSTRDSGSYLEDLFE